MNLKAISLACVIGLSTMVFSGCGNDNGNNNNGNGNAGNNGTGTSMNARSANRGTTLDRTMNTQNRMNAGRYGSATDDNAGNNRLFGNGNNGLFNGNDNDMNNNRGGLFGTGIGNGIDEDNMNGDRMLGNGMNDNRGGLFGTGLFSGLMDNDDNPRRGNGNDYGTGSSGRAGTGMNGIRSNGAGTSDSVGGTVGLRSNGTHAYNDALVLGNFLIVGKNGSNGTNAGSGKGASMQGNAGMGAGTQHVLQVTDPQALKALERVKQKLEMNIQGQDTSKLAKDLALVLKHAKEPKANKASKGSTAAGGRTSARAAGGR